MGFVLALISSAAFGLIPLFSLPLLHSGLSADCVLFYRFRFASLSLGLFLVQRQERFAAPARDLGLLALFSVLYALAALVTDEQLSADYILPSALDKSVADTVAHAVAQEQEEHPVLPAEPNARVSADCFPLPGRPGQGDGGPKRFRLGKEQAPVSHLPLPQGRAQDLFQLPPGRPGGQLAGGGGLHPQPALPVVVHCPAGLIHAF